MTTESDIIKAIKSQSNCLSNIKLKDKLEIIKFFIADAKPKSPQITAEMQGKNVMHAHMLKYFSDSTQIFFFLNPQNPQNYLKSKSFQSQAQNIFNDFLKANPQYSLKTQSKNQTSKDVLHSDPKPVSNEAHINPTQNPKPSKKAPQQPQKLLKSIQKVQNAHDKAKMTFPKIQFVKFVDFWLEKEQSVFLFYQKYEEAIQKATESFKTNLYDVVSKHTAKLPEDKKNQIKDKTSQIKSLKTSENIKKVQKAQNVPKEQVKPTDKQKTFSEKQNNQTKKQKAQEKDSKSQVKINKDLPNKKKQPQNLVEKSQKVEKSVQNLLPSQHLEKIQQNIENLESSITESKAVSCEEIAEQIVPQKVTPSQNFHLYLRKFYDHYCKKYLNTIRNQEFQKVADFYNSMSLTKFLVYLREIKLLKLDKSLTAKFYQQQFKVWENQKHSLQYEGFAAIVMLSLKTAFKTKLMVESKGYEHIGVLNRQNFSSVMGNLGVIVPSKKIIFSKIEDVRSLSRMVKSITKQQMLSPKQLKIPKENKGVVGDQLSHGHGFESNWDSNKLHPDLFLNEKQRKQQRLLQGLTIPKLNKLQPSKHMDQKLHEMVDEDYDPYLKRYNESIKSAHENGSGHGMMKRIDERIHHIVKKIR